MGFLEALGKIMIKLTGGEAAQEKRIKEWENSLTPEIIKGYEKQGLDCTEYWKTYERVQKEKQEARKAFIEESLNSLDYQKLSTYFATPRDAESDFIKDTATINTTPLFGKSAWIERMCKAPLVYGAVVQAHGSLFKPEPENNQLGMVVTSSLDPAYMHDTKWLSEVASKIGELKETSNVPADCKKLIHTLRNSQSIFCFKVGESVTGGPEAWCATFTLDKQKYLPGACMPANRIPPFLVSNELKENVTASLELVPANIIQNKNR